jgi:hypothetical protein
MRSSGAQNAWLFVGSMSVTFVLEQSMRLGTATRNRCLPKGCLKIGVVARHFHVSVDLLRLYERQGVLISIKSSRGTRHFTEHDYPWIDMLLRLVREARVNLTAIAHLLVQIPCWNIRHCGVEGRENCPIISDATKPCWVNRSKCPVVCSQDCYVCDVYRSAPQLESLTALLLAEHTASPVDAAVR